ncbi:Phosphatidylinositol 5-phosphate 4-kinase type-2 alpha [Trichoplax sp. H2]|uniref:1-phosphatidylinositol-5-phosphate 4-kinase n=1 Tax=Trichoplax adhaerens TaxID=10228 RepID=B3RQQ3_TRIAD|nr:hypothetical protein TRIADDRAFT_22804 [Trichoplax adhaerens]EDV27283.1 hypothetical protein TRIADDRAFT_22804 [Trichoplax adhaerens]RDD38630.1 Phosphatidylinositol 5-phosphate 4-kinase type-2 alpha [Trichoplax sp. H2]|eukprot:XP_002111279.1 hypothetical protein TRIADDRAFT_22804 [Trichoplax adhaerens]
MSSKPVNKKKSKSVKKIKPVKQKLKLFRSENKLLSVFMWGLNYSIEQLSHVEMPVMLLPGDFKAYSKTKVENYYFNEETLPGHFKYKEYCPKVFKKLRECFDIDDEQFKQSIAFSPLMQYGDSGKFFVSRDKQYVVKTIDSYDVETMHLILQGYHQYIIENKGVTLLPQYLGMYRITINHKENYLIVMRSVFSAMYPPHKKYDLKGSSVGRVARNEEKAKELPTFKDNDFTKDQSKLYIGDDRNAKIMEILTRDTEFLVKFRIMDYSLLLGIHDIERGLKERNHEDEEDCLDEADGSSDENTNGDDVDDSPAASPSPAEVCDNNVYAISCSTTCTNQEIYYLAIVDVLTQYGARKKAAHMAKTAKHGAGAEITTVNHKQYAERFMAFIGRILE